ncbi:MAG: sugar phosphate isomerase/epimerase [Opitutus sp.]|nr:sugar phosphate isomerase/epimerase [Opitutus sp.]
MAPSLVSRRQFLRIAAGAAATAGVARDTRAASAPKPGAFKFRFVLSTSLYGCLPIADIVPEMHRTGSVALDIWAGRWGNQREQVDALGHDKFAAMLQQHKATVGTYTCMDPGFMKAEPHLRAMKKFGGDMIVAGFGGGGPGAKDLRGDDLRRAIRGQVEKMKPAIDRAGELGVKLAIENHLNGLLEPPESLNMLADALPDKHVGIAFAPFHLPQDPGLLGKLAGDLGGKLFYYYAWQYGDGSGNLPADAQKKQMPGIGPLDFKPMIDALKRNRFDGWTSIFMHPTPRGSPLHPTAPEVSAQINRSRKYLESLV